jgi:hypothetical protein
MRILHEEIELREQTRALDQMKPAVEPEDYGRQATELSETQGTLAARVGEVTVKIEELPESHEKFAYELALLGRVEEVMLEAQQLLGRPETGAETIAAETEAIELLLQSRRINPKGGGGGGSSPGGGGTGDTDRAALALFGRGAERNAQYRRRTVRQSTGTSPLELPAEFREGLDAFFDALENSGAARAN